MKGRKRYNFGGEEGLDRFLREVKSVFDKLKTKEKIQFHEIVEQVAGGYTQTGKTAFKAALAILGKISGVANIVITTVVDNRRRLVHDLKASYIAADDWTQRDGRTWGIGKRYGAFRDAMEFVTNFLEISPNRCFYEIIRNSRPC